MWPSCGGHVCWLPARPSPAEARGVVVVFAWVWSDEAQLRPFVELYSSLGWLCLVCRGDLVLLYLCEKAASLASGVISELVKELKVKPLPTVLASFSGGSKGCMYMVIQLLDRKCEGDETMVSMIETHLRANKMFVDYNEEMKSDWHACLDNEVGALLSSWFCIS